MFFTPQDLLVVGFLIFLEGILSIDNALVLALLARGLPPDQQKRALTYGLVGAVVFRIIAVGLASYLIHWRWVKFVGGGYLLWVGLSHLLGKKKDEDAPDAKYSGFWKTVLVIELTDIAFAVDSILAAVALTNKVPLVIIGGVIGLILMRFAATVFLKLLHKFPRFETIAYVLVVVIGTKITLEAMRLPGIDFHSAQNPAFWIFWLTMIGCVLAGFRKPKKLR